MKKLMKYFKGYTVECILAPLFKLCEVVFELLVPLIMAQIIDIGIKTGDMPYIYIRCGVLIGFGIFGLGFALTAQYFAARAAVGFSASLRESMFTKINSLSFSQLDRLGASGMMTRMTNDVNQLQNGVNITLRLALRSPFVVFGAMVMAMMIDMRSSLIFAGAIIALFIVVFAVLLIGTPLYKKVGARTDILLRRTRENLSGIRVLRAFGQEKREMAAFSRENGEVKNTQLFVGRISALLNPLTYVLINIAILILLQTGAVRVNDGVLSAGEIIALYNYMSQILVELIKLANVIITINKSFASADRVNELLDMSAVQIVKDDGKIEDGSAPIIEFRGVSLRYNDGGENALDNISFTLKKGQTLGIIGGTGSGKTSLVSLISRFYDASEGEVLIFGKNVNSYSPKFMRERVAVAMQKPALTSGTVADNIRWGKKNASEEEIKNALETAQAWEFIERYDEEENASVAAGGVNFSGGQRQRMSVARALIKDAEILILDDSSSALDYATDLKLRRAINEQKGDKTLIIISQRAAAVMNADKILVLDDGKIVGEGRHDELLDNCDVYREIYEYTVRQK